MTGYQCDGCGKFSAEKPRIEIRIPDVMGFPRTLATCCSSECMVLAARKVAEK